MTASSSAEPGIVFLLDVDNTLLDNDRFKEDAAARIERLVGKERARRFWEIYEEVREDEDFVDYPETASRWAKVYSDPETARRLEELLENMPFAEYLYPHVLETLAYLNTIGEAVILSDGDQTFQPLKIRKSGLWQAVDSRVLIFVHKELELPKVFAAYPARHYVTVDDKPRILAVLERDCPTTFTTVLVLQGKYAVQGEYSPKPDYVVQHISDLREFPAEKFEKA